MRIKQGGKMGFYIRKSFKVGPIKLNLSKSGIGTSVGVKGFRVGQRPNGRQYVHAGRYGVYYKKDLGRESNENNEQAVNPEQTIVETNDQKKRETFQNNEIFFVCLFRGTGFYFIMCRFCI
jgi:hypothetical protein